MPEKTFKEKILEEFDKISFPTQTDYGCDGASDTCCGFCGGEYIDEFGTRVIIKDFISEALDRQRKEIIKELETIKLYMDASNCDCGEPYSNSDAADLVNELLDNLKKVKLI